VELHEKTKKKNWGSSSLFSFYRALLTRVRNYRIVTVSNN
jgi:hypothetical protein